MKLNITSETDANEIIAEYIIPQIKNQGIVVNTGEVKVQVWSEKSKGFIDYKPENVKFVFTR